MRFDKGHKERTRGHILEMASRRFRQDGVAASGIATIMADSGLTNGAFYAHFESKEALVRESLQNTLAQQCDRLEAMKEGSGGIEAVIRDYLDPAHVSEPHAGCPSAALLPEIGRQPRATRDGYEAGLLRYVALLASLLPQPESPATARRAMAIFASMVGTLQLARAVGEASLCDDILAGGVETALGLARREA